MTKNVYTYWAIIILLALVSQIKAQTGRQIPWQYFWQQALTAEKTGDKTAFLENSRKAVEAGPPNHPTLFYMFARSFAANGKKSEAAEWLEKTLVLGYGIDALNYPDFNFLNTDRKYAALRQRIETVKKAKVKSKSAFTIREPDLIPEGIAYDAKEKNIYLGSLYKRKIIKIDRRGQIVDFVKEAEDGLGSVLGIRVNPAQRELIALSNIAPNMKNFEKTSEGTGMLHRYDLETGKLLQKIVLPNKPQPHLLNDLAIASNGDIFITDSLASIVHVLREGKDNLESFAELAPYNYPNGIALSGDEKRLYVANLNGISVIETATGKVSPLAAGENAALAGTDGLYFFENSLIGIQNFELPNRVVRFFLDETGYRVVRLEILESNHPLYQTPTTGAISGRDFFYIANSQLRSFDDQGEIFPAEKLRPLFILKLKL